MIPGLLRRCAPRNDEESRNDEGNRNDDKNHAGVNVARYISVRWSDTVVGA